MADPDLIDDMGDTYLLADAAMMSWSPSPSSVIAGRVAGNCFRLNNTTIQRSVPSGVDRTVGVAWRPVGTTQAHQPIQFKEAANVHLMVQWNGDGTFSVIRSGSGSATLATSAVQAIAANVFYFLEFYGKIGQTDGDYELRLNETPILVGSGNHDTVVGAGPGVVTAIALNGAGLNYDFDDLYSAPGRSFKGDCRAIGSAALTDGANLAWIASSGTDVSCVDEATPNADTDYISSNNIGDIDTFGFAPLSAAGAASIVSVLVRPIVRKEDAGVRSIDEVVRSGGVNYVAGNTQPLAVTYVAKEGYFATDPATGLPWANKAAVDAAEYGVKLVA